MSEEEALLTLFAPRHNEVTCPECGLRGTALALRSAIPKRVDYECDRCGERWWRTEFQL